MPISSVSSGGPNLHRHFRVKTVSETVDKGVPIGLDGPGKIAASF